MQQVQKGAAEVQKGSKGWVCCRTLFNHGAQEITTEGDIFSGIPSRVVALKQGHRDHRR